MIPHSVFEEDEELRRILDNKFKEAIRSGFKVKRTNIYRGDVEAIKNCEPIIVTDQNFGEIIASEKPVVVDFWAEWCGPCRVLGPIISQLAREYCEKITFGKLNVDENPSTPSRFNIFSIPTLLFFKGGLLRERITGLIPKKQIENVILNLID